MKATTTSTFSLLVDNECGVLARVASLIRRSGWSIRSLSAAETEVPERSRLTICLECRLHSLEDLLERLRNLNCVHNVMPYSEKTQLIREYALLLLWDYNDAVITSLCEQYEAKMIERTDSGVYLSVAAKPSELDALISQLKSENGVLEIGRTGAVALNRKDKEA